MALKPQAAAFLTQSRSDLRAFVALLGIDRSAVPECHPLHHLQMACEKVAKAVHIQLGMDPERRSHVAFSRLPYSLARPDMGSRLGWRDGRAYLAFLRRTAPLFREIEQLSPAVGPSTPGGGSNEHPNTEYPWPRPSSEDWIAPAEHDFGILRRMRDRGDIGTMVTFVERLIDRFESVVGT